MKKHSVIQKDKEERFTRRSKRLGEAQYKMHTSNRLGFLTSWKETRITNSFPATESVFRQLTNAAAIQGTYIQTALARDRSSRAPAATAHEDLCPLQPALGLSTAMGSMTNQLNIVARNISTPADELRYLGLNALAGAECTHLGEKVCWGKVRDMDFTPR